MLRIYKLLNIRNRAYVVDSKGNKLFFGTEFQCKKFIEYIMEGEKDDAEIRLETVRETKH